MPHYYAQIDADGIAIGNSESHGAITLPNMIEQPSFDTSVRGQKWTGSAWQPAPAAPPDSRLWWLDIGPFKDRLGMDAPAIYASSHSACKGLVGLLEGRKYVDLKDPRIKVMLDVLIAAGQPAADPVWPGSGPMTASKRDAIVNTPTTADERHIPGLAP